MKKSRKIAARLAKRRDLFKHMIITGKLTRGYRVPGSQNARKH